MLFYFEVFTHFHKLMTTKEDKHERSIHNFRGGRRGCVRLPQHSFPSLPTRRVERQIRAHYNSEPVSGKWPLLAFFICHGRTTTFRRWLFPVLATGVLNIGIMYAKTRARALEQVSLVTPIDSTTPAIVIITAMIIIGEYPTKLGWLGVWVLVLGTYILNIQELRQKLLENTANPSWQKRLLAWIAPFLALRRSAGVRWAFFAGRLVHDQLELRRPCGASD